MIINYYYKGPQFVLALWRVNGADQDATSNAQKQKCAIQRQHFCCFFLPLLLYTLHVTPIYQVFSTIIIFFQSFTTLSMRFYQSYLALHIPDSSAIIFFLIMIITVIRVYDPYQRLNPAYQSLVQNKRGIGCITCVSV